jgi:UDP-N-acetylglucosamine 2-epimerase (non-hydrolysing)
MSDVFFRELGIPEPLANLRAGSGSHAVQTATIMRRLESVILGAKPDVVIVPGDTNTTLAGALSAAKLGIPVAHIEAGLRSGDMTLPEEINRRLTDHCSSFLFAPTRTAVSNLRTEGLGKLTYLTGDTMVDALRIAMPTALKKQKIILGRFGLRAGEYVLVTLHRPSNVDDVDRLGKIQDVLQKLARRFGVVFPIHPRTRARLTKLGGLKRLAGSGVILTSPQGYIQTLSLLKNASCLLTDSGGMQKESLILHIPCVTLRLTTEWPETLAGGANQLISRPEMILGRVLSVASDEKLKERIRTLKNPFGDGFASRRIVSILNRAF